jgi:coniferyl-aldehyde dehydrogenase
VPKEKLEATVEALKQSISQSYPTLRNNGDYTAVVNDKHRERLLGLIADAKARGARVIEINPANEQLDSADGKIAPTLIVGVDDGMRVMQEEIFGPVLPIMAYDSLEQALQYVNDHPRPLALYYFDNDKARVREVLDKTVAGGVTINDTLLHFAAEDLPFGGVGPSGMGAYHGYDGFVTFSHKKAVLYQAKFNGSAQMNPPYQPRLDKLLDFLIGK